MPLVRTAEPFDHPDWLFELKWDGFRAVAYVEDGQARLVSRNGHTFRRFPALEQWLGANLPCRDAILDGEIVCLDRDGRADFNRLLYRRGDVHFVFVRRTHLSG
jgi:bifunctional non-homologous end joining protein LigD